MDYETGLAVCQAILDLLYIALIYAAPLFWRDFKEFIRG